MVIQLFKVNNGNTKTMREMSSKLTMKTPEGRSSGIFINHIFNIVDSRMKDQLQIQMLWCFHWCL